jgi:hypothetical protein
MTNTPLAPPPPRALLDPNGNVSDRFYQWLGSLQKGISGAFSGIGEINAQQEAIDFTIESPDNQDYLFEIDCPFGYKITQVDSQCRSGTCIATTKIGVTALGGGANSVSTSLQTKTHTSANVIAAAGTSVVTISSNSSCAGLRLTFWITRT